jgi:peptidoglycan/xylan/chitin deacetylase (PgdA/CDA1 family)
MSNRPPATSEAGSSTSRRARSRRLPGRTAWLVILGSLILAFAALLVLTVHDSAGGAATSGNAVDPIPTTVVSLTFDDGPQTQYAVRAPLAAHGMRGTFYVNSGLVGSTTSDWHMTWSQLHDLASDGNEVTGHSLTHGHLAQLSSADLRRQVCQDRRKLLNQGFSPVASFAYPYGEYNAAVTAMARQCGYSSARQVSGIRASDCDTCPYAETIPPENRWAIRAPRDIDSRTTVATMESYVKQAENNGGGWVVLVIHSVCDGCDPYSITVQHLTEFLDWLQPRSSIGTAVKTHGEVIAQGAA